jgi:RHS repeat-associated protein
MNARGLLREKTQTFQYDNHLGSACLELEMHHYAAWLCRFINVDPLQFEYPYYTPFQYAGNKPISYIDLDGGEPRSNGSIDATFYFTFEPGLKLNIIQKLRYIKQFQRNVRQVWNSYNYNGNQVNVNRIRFEFANGKKQGNLKPYEFLITVGNGTTADRDTIFGRSYVKGNTGYMYYSRRASEAAHEFGHFFGLADRYVNYLIYGKIKGSKNADSNSLRIGGTIPLVLAEIGYNPLTNLYSSTNGTSLTQTQLNIIFNKQVESTYIVPVVLLNSDNYVPQLLKVTSKGLGFTVTEFNMENNIQVGTNRILPWAYQISIFKNHSKGACEPYLNVKAYKNDSAATIRNNWTLIKERTRF